MLQPRRGRKPAGTMLLLLLLALDARFARGSRGETTAESIIAHNLNRERRQNDATSVLLSPNTAWAPVGVLSSTARTFVQDGTTTEYATQLVATTAEGGQHYTQVLLTTSRVFYDASVVRPVDHHVRPTTQLRPHFVYPSKQPFILPARQNEKVVNVFALPETMTNSEQPVKSTTETQYRDALDEILRQSNDVKKFGTGTQFAAYKDIGVRNSDNEEDSSENQLKAKRMGDYFVGSGSERQASQEVDFNELKPAKVVRPVDGLPTFTVRHDFAPSGFSVDDEEDTTESRRKDSATIKNGKPRSGKLLFRGGALNSLKKLDTVTYYGFADFSTTVGDTVIIFMPSTKSAETPSIPVTSISGAATLSNEQVSVVTTVKTFMSHTPGMVTRTVTGHSLSMQTALPTMVVLPETSNSGVRNNKALDSSVHVTDAAVDEETEPPESSYDQLTFEQTSSFLAQEQEMFQSTTPDSVSSSEYEIEPSLVDVTLSSTLESKMSEIVSSDDKEILMSTPYLTEVMPEPTELPWTFATTRTQEIDHRGNPSPEGLIKAIAGTRALDGTTTLFTSLIYGTYEAGKYTQVIHSTSSVFFFVDETTSPEPMESETIKPSTVLETPPATETSEAVLTTQAIIDLPPTTTEETTTPSTTDETQKMIHDADDDSMGTVAIETTTAEMNNEIVNEIDSQNIMHTNLTEATKPIDETTEAVQEHGEINESAKDVISSQDIIQQSLTETYNLGQITQLIPSKVFKTFTYLTTFFIPEGPSSTTTSVRSREVISEEITFLTRIIDIPKTSQIIQISPSPTMFAEHLATTDSETDITPDMDKVTESEPEIISTDTPVDVLQETEKQTDDMTEESTTEFTPSPTPAMKLNDSVNVDKEEIDLIFKTLYTTFTYLTTFFHETTTSVSSREVVVTNVVTSTLDKNFLARETDPAVAGLFGRDDSLVTSEIMPTSVGVGRPTTQYLPEPITNPDTELFSSVIDSVDVEKELASPTPTLENEVESKNINEEKLKTYYKTYTYFTTIFVDDETTVTSKTEVFTNIITPSKQLIGAFEKTVEPSSSKKVYAPLSSVLTDQLESPQSNIPNIIQPSREYTPLRSLVFKSTPHYSYSSTISRNPQKSEITSSQFQDDIEIADDEENKILSDGTSYLDREYAYSTTISRPHATQNTEINVEKVEASKSPIASRGINEESEGENIEKMVVESMSTDVTSSTSGGGQMLMLERNDRHSPLDDQISSESNTEEIQPSATLLLQTYFTTFTFFTTLYKGASSSDVISRLETVTNVVTETLSPQATTQVTETDDHSLPITYFTTYTYWTTLYKDGSSTITSREETVSNVITPTATKADLATSIITETPPVNIIPEILPSELLELPSSLSSDPSTSNEPAIASTEELTSSIDNNGPTTVYTTYTYFMTSYIGDSTIVNSRLETVSSVLNSTTPQNVKSGKSLGDAPPSEQLLDDIIKTTPADGQSPQSSLLPTGLLSTILTSQVNNGTTTLYSTDVFGTYIDGFYAKVLESSTTIVTPSSSQISTSQANLQPTGIVSLNEGRIIDADGVTTTFFATKAIGTYIDNLYAQVVESSSSLKVDPEKQSLIATLSTADPFRTGLVRIIDGFIIKDNTTTFYESKVVGTQIDGRYAQIIESTSSFKIDMTPTPVPPGLISASSAQIGIQDVLPTVSVSTLPSPVVIESSINDGESKTESDTDEESDHAENDGKDDSDEENDEASSSGKSRVKSKLTYINTRKTTFTPQIRPFVIKSRNRPAFNPRQHKSSATTITRNAITPTITASPAKSNERTGPGSGGSSRGRFSGNRRQSSQNNAANEIQPTLSSGSRRFSRNRGSSTSGLTHSSSSFPGRTRGRASTSGRVYATLASSSGIPSRRASIYKSSAGRGSSSIYPGGPAGRLRIRPTLSSGLGRGFSSTAGVSTTPKSSDDTLSPDDTTLTVTEETDLYAEEDQETPTQPISTSTESLRRSTNPLLRLRRPLNLRTQQGASTTPRTSTTPPKKNSRKQSSENRSQSTTPKSLRSRPFPSSSITSRYKPVGNRPRPGNSLFPPRGLFRKPEQEENEEEENEKNEENENEETENNDEDTFTGNEDIGDNDYEGSEKSESKTLAQPANRRSGNLYQPVQIRPFPRLLRKPRSKRQAEYGTRREGSAGRTYGRFRRPGSKSAQAQDRADTTEETVATPDPPKSKSSNTGRFTPRQRNQSSQNAQKIRPTSSTSNSGRAQFTLREKDTVTNTRSNFKRPSTSSPRRRQNKNSQPETTSAPVPQRPKPPRLRTQQKTQSHAQKTPSHTQQTETTYTRANPPRYRNTNTNTNRGRGNTRTRYRSETTDVDTFTYSPSTFDGTITVTHQVPTEVTIPVLNGKVTEYRNIITASPSTEVLGPHQYTATIGKEGNTIYVLTSEATGTLPGGVTEITQYFLRDTPTTSVVFTPTMIRGRKTSFSHIVPSTVYDVEQVVSTLQPQISPNAPLANILLSQLLLGNLGLQPNINPLLALNNNNGPPPSPTTEYKTRTTTYVTTVTKGTSTVIPLTFRGKEILTTIVDQSEEVITATEFLTDTIVVTPTPANNQLNSLLLPALLQAQLLGQNQPQTTSNPLLGLQQQLLQPENVKILQNDVPTLDDDVRRRGIQTRQRADDDADRLARESESDDILDNSSDSLQAAKDDSQSQNTRSNQRKRFKVSDPKPPDPPPAPAEISVVTLYVSGRRPGEFSTVLSTVTLGDEHSIRKREVRSMFDTTATVQMEADSNDINNDFHAGAIRVDASEFPDLGSSFTDHDNEIADKFIMPAMSEISADVSTSETQSLESMVGDVSRYVSAVQTAMNVHPASPSITRKTNERDAATTATKKINGTGHFLLNSPAELPPLQRKGMVLPNGGSIKSQTLIDDQKCYVSVNTFNICKTNLSLHGDKILKRETRDLTTQSAEEIHYKTNNTRKRRRKLVRIKVPVHRDRTFSEEDERDILALSEAQRKETIPNMDTSQPIEDFFEDDEHKPPTRRVKVIRSRKPSHSENIKETKNEVRQVKRILVARRKRPMGFQPKPVQDQLNDDQGSTGQTISQNLHEAITVRNTHEKDEIPNSSIHSRVRASSSRKLIRVTKKLPLSQLPVTDTVHKRRIIVTKRRPTHKTHTDMLLTLPVTVPTSTHSHQHSDKEQNKEISDADIVIYPTVMASETYNDQNTNIEITESKFTQDISSLPVVKDSKLEMSRSIATPIYPSVIEPALQEPQSGIFGSQITLPRKDYDSVTLLDQISTTKTEPQVLETKISKHFSTPEHGIMYESQNYAINQNFSSLLDKEEHKHSHSSSELTEANNNATVEESATEMSEDKIESSSSYEGPRFIRPTRFSITRRPGRTKTSFSGQKHRNSSPSTTQKATPSSNYKSSYRGRKSSSRSFGRSSNSRGFRTSTRLPKIQATETSYAYGSVESTSSTSLLSLVNTVLQDSVPELTVSPSEIASESITTETTPPLPDIITTATSMTEHYVVLPTTSREHEAVPTNVNISDFISKSKAHTDNRTEQLTQIITPVLTTHILTTTRLRTYTFIVTRVDGTDEYITSTTEVKPHVTKVTLTEQAMTTAANMQGASGRSLTLANPNEARLHLATKIMSNGVEVIVAGDRSTMPGDPEVLRILTSSLVRPITLAPSTLSDQMVMLLPQSESQEPSSTSLPCREMVTKTYLTTYTYMTTFLQGGSTTISSSKKIVSNIVTEEASALVTLPPPAYTLTGSPSMSTGVFHTTYTYLNTVMDGGQPLVLTSKHTVANTVTAPEEHFAKVSHPSANTNTYLNTVTLTKTMTGDAGDVSITSTNDVVTQVVITESENPQLFTTRPVHQGSFTDIVKTYFVTYTYYNTFMQDGSTVVHSDIAISSDIVTEKVFVPQKKTSIYQEIPQDTSKELDIHATKTYFTTYTYYTTLPQEAGQDQISTVIRTRVVQNVVSETVPSSLLPSDYMSSVTNYMKEDSTDTIVATATLSDGHEMMVTVIERDKDISPTSIQNTAHPTSTGKPELVSSMEDTSDNPSNVITGSTIIFFDNYDQESSSEYSQPTPALTNSYVQTTILQQDGDTMKPVEPLPLTTEVFSEDSNSDETQNPQTNTVSQSSGDETYTSPTIITTILATSTIAHNGATLQPGEQVIMMTQANGSVTMIPVSDPAKNRPVPASGDTSGESEIHVSDLLSLGSLGINGLNALGPVINAMAGLIQSNLKRGDVTRRNDTINLSVLTSPKPITSKEQPHPVYIPDSSETSQSDSGVRSPIYIPVGGLAVDFEKNPDDIIAAESQNYENRVNLNGGNVKWLSQLSDAHERKRPSDVIMGRPTMESPLLSDGIPISPGQVITANSDVIIGKPAIMGPRPPKLNNNNDVPIGMKPPPLPHSWPPKLHAKPVIPHIHPPFRPMPEDNVHLQPPLPFAADHPPRLENSRYSLPIPDNQNIFNFGPSKPLEVSSVQTVFLGKPIKHSHHEHHSTANDIIHGIPEPPMAHAEPVPIGIPTVDSVNGQPMLVNIQPSQVANVLIPHGRPTESVYTLGGGVTGGLGGIGSYYDNSPFPFPETSPEFIGLDDSGQHSVGTVHSDNEKSQGTEPELHIPAGSINVDISPGQGINVGVAPVHVAPSGMITESQKTDVYSPGYIFDSPNQQHAQNHQSLKQKIPVPSVPSGFMVPPPPPLKSKQDPALSRLPLVIPLNEERLEDNSNSHKKKDNPYGNDKMEGEIQVVQESIRRPLRPGQIPVELKLHNSVSTHRPIFFSGTSDLKPPTKFDSPAQSRPYITYVDKPPPLITRPQPPPVPISNKKYNTAHPAERPHIPQVYISPQQPTQRPNNIPHNIAILGRPQPVESYAAVDAHPQLPNKKPLPPNFSKPNVPNNHHMLQENVGENGGPYDENKHQNKLPDLSVHLVPPPIHPPTHHGSRPQLPKFDSSTDNKETSQTKRPGEKLQRPKFPSIGSLPFDLEVQSNTPKPFYEHPPLSQPMPPTRKPMLQMEPSQKKSEVSSQMPGIGHEVTSKKPESAHKFTLPTKTEPQNTNLPSWGRPALHEIPSPQQPTISEHFQDNLQEETSTTNNSVSTYKPIITKYNPPYINKPISNPSSVHTTTQVPSKGTLISEITNTVIGTTTVHYKNTVKPTKHAEDEMLQTVVIGKPIQEINISPTTVKKSSSNIAQWTTKEPESSFADEGTQVNSAHSTSYSVSTTDVINTQTLLSGSETYYGELFTRPASTVTDTVPTYRPAEFESNAPETDVFEEDDYEKARPDLGVASSNDETIIFLGDDNPYVDTIPSYTLPTRYVTHTQTLTVTTTETIVVSSLGKMPSTKTLVLTKTQTSTVVDTVTETRTLVKPTSVTATVTTTVSTTLLGTPPAVSRATTEHPSKQSTTTRKPTTEEENESFFVVVNDHKSGKEGTVNNAVFLGGVLVPGTAQPVDENSSTISCRPDCSAARNELCRESEGRMHCICRPGFARMFPDQPCKPTYTYNMMLPLERHGKMKLHYDASLEQAGLLKHNHLSEATREGLDRMVMQSDLRDIYHGVAVRGFKPTTSRNGVLVNFYVQLSENTDEERLKEVFKKSIRATNYSLGGTDVFADKKLIELLEAEDFNECSSSKFHDCSENAHCFNLRGTYTCSCKEGYADLSENSLFPGRVCSAELIGCEKCHYHGSCHSQVDDQVTCECFQWYTGENCQINLKVLLIALVTIGAVLLALLLVCIVLACLKKCRASTDKPHRSAPGFLRYRGTNVRGDKRAMIQDSSSEGSIDNGPISFIPPPPQPVNLRPMKKPSAMKKVVTTVEPAETIPSFTDQRDRSLTVMIPRAKYRPVQPMSSMLTMSTFGAPEKRAIAQEQKLISYLENGGKQENRSKPVIPVKKQSTASNQKSEPAPSRKTSYSQLRKQSISGTSKTCGALVSAGFEVSATVSHKVTTDAVPEMHNTLASNESEHTTLRTGDRTVSEARSCDETTIQAPTKTLHSHYGSKNGSNTLNNDEAHTMAERDLGSTLLLPQTHLYKPDRGSDISNFDSL